MRIYELRTSSELNRPQIEHQSLEFGQYDWLKIGKVLDGELDISDYPAEISIATQYKDSRKTDSWDYFSNPGTLGLFSEKLIMLLGERSLIGLQPLPVFLDNLKYYHLKIKHRVDWIDFENSEVERLPSGTILNASHLALHKEKVPVESVFVNDGLKVLLLTRAISERLVNVHGIQLIPVSDLYDDPISILTSAGTAQYCNEFFDLRIEIPEPWVLLSWQRPESVDAQHFQIRNDDLPEREGQSKFLFNALLYKRSSEVSVDAKIELSVSRKHAHYDMRQGITDNFTRMQAYYRSNDLETEIVRDGSWSINEVEYQYLEEMLTDKNGRKSKYRFVFRKINDSLWLYAKIAGHNESSYQQALNIFSTLTWGTRGKLAPTP